MRYDTPIYLQMVTKGEYNASTGDYEPETVTEIEKYAAVHDTGSQTMRVIYGEIKRGSVTVQLQQHLLPEEMHFTRIRIGETLYSADFSRKLKSKHIFVCSEVI